MPLVNWTEAGILKQTADEVAPLLRILPFQELWIACDISGLKKLHQEEFVMGIAGSSLTLANATIRRQSDRTLDIGTGCGIQAFMASRHSEQVSTIDRDPRAIDIARFNAKLNDLENVEFFEGDLFEPVRGRKFNLIVSNPPFVISPEFRAHYRDGGLGGDELCQQIVRKAPEFLDDGGFCQILCNWLQKAGIDWRERWAGWFKDCGCDVWVMRGNSMDPSEYTMSWNKEEAGNSGFGKTYRNWMAYFEREQVESIGVGLITMRRTSG